jgi:hypothetical protein
MQTQDPRLLGSIPSADRISLASTNKDFEFSRTSDSKRNDVGKYRNVMVAGFHYAGKFQIDSVDQ